MRMPVECKCPSISLRWISKKICYCFVVRMALIYIILNRYQLCCIRYTYEPSGRFLHLWHTVINLSDSFCLRGRFLCSTSWEIASKILQSWIFKTEGLLHHSYPFYIPKSGPICTVTYFSRHFLVLITSSSHTLFS